MHLRFFLLCCLFIAQSVAAIEVDGLFTAEVSTPSQSREDRNKALREALLIVIDRLTIGDEFAQNPAVQSALDNAAVYVDQYQYAHLSDDLNKNSQRLMRIIFLKKMVMELMQASGLPVWSEERDQVLVWVVIEQQGVLSILDSDQNPGIESALQEAAKSTGIPVLLPLMDLEEKQVITVKDLLASKSDKVLATSARYDVATLLTAKLIKRRSCWRSEWALHFNNKLEQWKEPCTGLETNLTGALQKVYRQLVSVYAQMLE